MKILKSQKYFFFNKNKFVGSKYEEIKIKVKKNDKSIIFPNIDLIYVS